MSKYDSVPFDAAAAARAGEGFYYQEDGHTARYSGPLGSFEFDRNQFELRKYPVPASGGNPATDMVILKYIGAETDGRKISIPKGCTDISLTFAGTGITSAPRIPGSVRYAVGAFRDCGSLTDARGSMTRLPLSMKDASFMFADCPNLRRGPDIPGSTDAMDGMYYNCRSLAHTPSVGSGVVNMNYAFAGCESLTRAPRVPGSALNFSSVTALCPGIDDAKDRERERETRQSRDRYEKSLDRKGLAGTIGNAFAACLQFHALRKQGYSLLYAPFAVHKMRQRGMMGTTFAAGVADALDAGDSVNAHALSRSLRQRDERKAGIRTYRREQKLAEWDRMYGDGAKPTMAVREMALDGAADWESGLLYRLSHAPEEEKRSLLAGRAKTAGCYEGMEAAVKAHWGDGGFDEDVRRKTADWYKERLDENLAYYKAAARQIDGHATAEFTEDERKGLHEMMRVTCEPLIQSVSRMQSEYHILDEGDLRRFDAAMREMGFDSGMASREQRESDLSRTAADRFAAALSGTRAYDKPAPEPETAPKADPGSGVNPLSKSKPKPKNGLDDLTGVEPVDLFGSSAPGTRRADMARALEDLARRTKHAAAAGMEAFARYGKPDEPREAVRQHADVPRAAGSGGADVADAREQTKLDEAVASGNAQAAAEDLLDKARADKRGLPDVSGVKGKSDGRDDPSL